MRRLFNIILVCNIVRDFYKEIKQVDNIELNGLDDD